MKSIGCSRGALALRIPSVNMEDGTETMTDAYQQTSKSVVAISMHHAGGGPYAAPGEGSRWFTEVFKGHSCLNNMM